MPDPKLHCTATAMQPSTGQARLVLRSLAIGTKAGYKLFSLSSVEQLDQVHGSNEIPDVYIVERLFSSSLVVVVSHTKPRQMNVYHFKKGTEICNYSYSSNILSIRLNRQRLLVCLEESIYIHNIKDMKLLKTLLDIPSNPTGLCALSINHSNSYLAYPGSQTTGEIVLYDGNSLKTVCTIAAHEGTLAAITFNSSGSKLASASGKVSVLWLLLPFGGLQDAESTRFLFQGTVIRVFSVPDGQKLHEFRRGMKRYVTISSLVFSMDSQFLCASSNTETVHIFKLEHLTDRQVQPLCRIPTSLKEQVPGYPAGPGASLLKPGPATVPVPTAQAHPCLCIASPSRPEEPSTWSGYMGKMFMAATNYLPAQVSDMMNQDRAFATGRLNFSGQKNICTLSTYVQIQKLPRLLVASSDGHLYIYNLDPQDGGECVLIKTHRCSGDVLLIPLFFLFLIAASSLLSSGTEENKENDLRPSLPPSYAATVARPSTSAASTVPGEPPRGPPTGLLLPALLSRDGGALRGEVIPEHEFATGPVCLDDENEFPPVSIRNP
ncbi:hypothetical protein A6R68_12571 [Neotoma lepida]|uniref:WD repeat domain phosphoinositide-interacting protein 1 n=1 Tax=Neotoma lepida TaxID=56216 RepID=A0A1A6H3G6_NEOLE|nr:hypothetical protein A6R68_12571 [Neotoma lepida]